MKGKYLFYHDWDYDYDLKANNLHLTHSKAVNCLYCHRFINESIERMQIMESSSLKKDEPSQNGSSFICFIWSAFPLHSSHHPYLSFALISYCEIRSRVLRQLIITKGENCSRPYYYWTNLDLFGLPLKIIYSIRERLLKKLIQLNLNLLLWVSFPPSNLDSQTNTI